jgi:type III secretion system FlhB-like substrate exporter
MKDVIARFRSAAALAYNEADGQAPTLVAKGERRIADMIVTIAERYGVPVVERGPLARALLDLQEGDEIPEHIFEAVAAVIVELDKAQNRSKAR